MLQRLTEKGLACKIYECPGKDHFNMYTDTLNPEEPLAKVSDSDTSVALIDKLPITVVCYIKSGCHGGSVVRLLVSQSSG